MPASARISISAAGEGRSLERSDRAGCKRSASIRARQQSPRLPAGPAAAVCVGTAEQLPFPDRAVAGAVFLNSLHHVPGMSEALRESGRVVGSGATVVIIEPLTEGSFFRAILPIEDETVVRQEAQRAVQAALADGVFVLQRILECDRRDLFTGIEQFVERATAADQARERVVRERRGEIERAFRQEAVSVAEAATPCSSHSARIS